ncbi:MAG: polysaccharide lyase family 7 protein [Ferrimonas sp.]
MTKKSSVCAAVLLSLPLLVQAHAHPDGLPVAHAFDMTQWKITLPMDQDNDSRADEIKGVPMQNYQHPDFFYLNEKKELVFQVPNRAVTTQGSTNARSELRQMLWPDLATVDKREADPANNWVLAAHPEAKNHATVGGVLSATLVVDHVAKNSASPEKMPAYSVVVGQIHAGGQKDKIASGFGYGNEPLKIFYKKWPEHQYGSVFWTYERNLAKEDSNRQDIAFPVWGHTWDNGAEPGEAGIALGESFSYKVEVVGNDMHLTFTSPRHGTQNLTIDLSKGLVINGQVDTLDNPRGYAEDWFYYKAGAYGQCNVNAGESFWATNCRGSGDWATDFANGDYHRVRFTELALK